MLSVVIPTFNEEKTIAHTADVVADILTAANIPFEIIFVDDGSKDFTWRKIQLECENNTAVVGITFSKNFGKDAAIMAGLETARGDCCVVIDCDLQQPPEKILEMYKLWEEGYEVIEGQKSSRGNEGIVHKLSAKLFYSIISKATKVDMSNASDFKLLDRKAVNSILQLKEKNAFFRALSSWVGYKTAYIKFDVQERFAGKSKWSRKALIKYALSNISSFSAFPLHVVTFLGAIMLLFSIILGTNSLIQYFSGQALEGFTTVILIQLFMGSITMISLGIMGYYISKIYEEVMNRPRYIISEVCRNNASKEVHN